MVVNVNPGRVDLPPCSDSPSCSQKIDGDVCNDGESVLNILLNKPEEHSLPEKPSAIRTGKIFPLNSKIISIGSMKADDNGPYIYRGNVLKLYYYDEIDGAFVVHTYDDMLYYYNTRIACRYSKEFVSPEK